MKRNQRTVNISVHSNWNNVQLGFSLLSMMTIKFNG